MDDLEISAFQAYNESKKEKRKKKKVRSVNIEESLDDGNNVPQGLVPVAHSKRKADELSEKSDAIWDHFVDDLHLQKKKKVTSSTPLQALFGTTNGSGSHAENIFLGKPKKKKTKLAGPKVSIEPKELSFEIDYSCDAEKQRKTCTAGHSLKGRSVCKKCKQVEKSENHSLKHIHLTKKTMKIRKDDRNSSFTKENNIGNNEEIENQAVKKPNADLSKVTEKRKRKLKNKAASSFEEKSPIEDTVSEMLRLEKETTTKPTNENSEGPDEENSIEKGRKMLEWILSPVSVEEFFDAYWEKKPLYIARSSPGYFDGIFSLEDLDLALRQSPMYFGKNVDVTAYENGKRTTENPEGRARPAMVWEKYRQGRSIRVLNPQTFIPNIGIMVSTLQEYFRCMVGVNSYLTPAGTQGFAPHYDDIEAFVLQLEGEKLWKVYEPRHEGETLPRFSSPNFSQDELLNDPILEVQLKRGDLLYFPRGFIHQARSVDTQHSLHITLSTYQCNTWGDLLQKALPAALDLAREEIVELREGLPLNFLDHIGAVHSDSESPERANIVERLIELVDKVVQVCPWDAAADQMGKQFIHDSYPPTVPDVPQKETWEKWFRKPRTSDVAVKLATAYCIRLVIEGEALMVYYNTDNSKEYHGEDHQCFEIATECGPIVENLLKNYPSYTRLKDLPKGEPIRNADLKKLLIQFFSHSLLLVKTDMAK